MKSFMQMALATFGIMTLILAGCSVPTPDEDTDTTDEGTSIELEMDTPTEEDMMEDDMMEDDGEES